MSYFRSYLSFLLPITLALAICSCTPSQDQLSGLLGHPAPLSRYTALDGSYHSMEELRGKKIVVVFWAEWCAYSRPVVKRLATYAKERRGGDNVVFLAVSIDRLADLNRVQDLANYGDLDGLELAFSGNSIDDEAYLSFQAKDLPHVFVLDEQGIVMAEGHSASVASAAW